MNIERDVSIDNALTVEGYCKAMYKVHQMAMDDAINLAEAVRDHLINTGDVKVNQPWRIIMPEELRPDWWKDEHSTATSLYFSKLVDDIVVMGTRGFNTRKAKENEQ